MQVLGYRQEWHSLATLILGTDVKTLGNLVGLFQVRIFLAFLGSFMSVCLFCFSESYILGRGSLMAQMVKTLPAVQETWIRSLGWGDPLEKGKATCSSILA